MRGFGDLVLEFAGADLYEVFEADVLAALEVRGEPGDAADEGDVDLVRVGLAGNDIALRKTGAGLDAPDAAVALEPAGAQGRGAGTVCGCSRSSRYSCCRRCEIFCASSAGKRAP